MPTGTFIAAVDVDGDAAMQVAGTDVTTYTIIVHNDHTADQFLHLYNSAHGATDPSMAAGDIVIEVRTDTELVIPMHAHWDALTVAGSTTAAAGGSAATAMSLTVLHDDV